MSAAWTIPDEAPVRCEGLCGAGTYDPEADGWTHDHHCPDCWTDEPPC